MKNVLKTVKYLCISAAVILLSGCEKNAENITEKTVTENTDTTVSCITDSIKTGETESVTPETGPEKCIQKDKTGWTEIDIFEGIEYYSFTGSEEYRTISINSRNILYPVIVYPELQDNIYWNQFCSGYLSDEQKDSVYRTGSTGTNGYYTDGTTEISSEEIPCREVIHLSSSGDQYAYLPVTDTLTFTLSFKSDRLFEKYLDDNHYILKSTEKTFTVNTDESEIIRKCAEDSISQKTDHETTLLTEYIFGGAHNLTGDEKHHALTAHEAAESYRKDFTENKFKLYPEKISDFRWDWCQEFIMPVKDETDKSYYPVRVIKIRNGSTAVWTADYPFDEISFTPADWDSSGPDDAAEFIRDELVTALGEWEWTD